VITISTTTDNVRNLPSRLLSKAEATSTTRFERSIVPVHFRNADCRCEVHNWGHRLDTLAGNPTDGDNGPNGQIEAGAEGPSKAAHGKTLGDRTRSAAAGGPRLHAGNAL
jgi:hypothetical protein